MKRHHVVAVCVFIFGGLFAYLQFHHGDTGCAIRTGIICILLGIAAFLFEKLRYRLRPVGVAVPLAVMGLMAAHAAFTGDIAATIFLCIGVIGIGVCHFFKDTPFFQQKIEPYVGVIVLVLITLILFLDTLFPFLDTLFSF